MDKELMAIVDKHRQLYVEKIEKEKELDNRILKIRDKINNAANSEPVFRGTVEQAKEYIHMICENSKNKK